MTYPINNLDVGGGEKDNINFKSHSQTTFNFPLTLTYNVNDDPNKAVLTDLLTKCGIIGGSKQNLEVEYKITVCISLTTFVEAKRLMSFVAARHQNFILYSITVIQQLVRLRLPDHCRGCICELASNYLELQLSFCDIP